MSTPNLFIVGAPKCGTTAWVSYLRSHPDIFFPNVKEPNYFNTDFPKESRTRREEEYTQLFRSAKNAKVVGEASVLYLYSLVAAKNIRQFNADARIIVFLREQSFQLPSLHNQLLYNGVEWVTDFEQAWALSEERGLKNVGRSRLPRLLNYRAQGAFYDQVDRYLQEFPSEQIRIFHFRDWSTNPRATYQAILGFLGVPDDGRSDFPPVHEAIHHKIKTLGRLTQAPPLWALNASYILKRITRTARLPFIDAIRNINRSKGYQTIKPSQPLLDEIRSYYAEQNTLLERYIWKPPTKVSELHPHENSD